MAYSDLFVTDKSRFSLFPIKHPQVYEMYGKLQQTFWQASEVDITGDRFEKLSPQEQHCVSTVLAFFSGSDGIVMDNIVTNFLPEVSMMEARLFYGAQTYNEGVHTEMYGKLIDQYITNETEKAKLFAALDTIPAIRKKGDWAMKWMDGKRSFVERLVAFAIIEGVFFSSSFAVVFWFRKRNNLLPGLIASNEFISRDEAMHTNFACMLYKNYCSSHKIIPYVLREIMDEAVAIEQEFAKEAILEGMADLTAAKMNQYVEYVADELLLNLGHDTMYDSVNPFEFMVNISLENKSNFFEARPTEYRTLETGGGETIKFNSDF